VTADRFRVPMRVLLVLAVLAVLWALAGFVEP